MAAGQAASATMGAEVEGVVCDAVLNLVDMARRR